MWEALVWWAPEALAGRVAWFILRKPVQMIAGFLLGPRYRVIRDDLAAFRRNPGRGDAAARLIECAPHFDKAVSIFNEFRLARPSIESAHVHSTMINRLRHEGPTPETHQFLTDEKIDERRPVYSDNMTDEKRNYEELYQYESRVMLFDMALEELRGDL